jgi:hypothetical protein
VLERSLGSARLGEGGEQRRDPLGKPTEYGVRERDRALQTGTAHQLDGFVDRGVARNAIDESELVGPQSQSRTHGRIEASDAAPAKRLDGVVECSGALNRTERKSLRQCAVARVEAGNRRWESAISVRAVLEDSQQNLKSRRAGRPYDRSPRSHAS